MRTKKDRKKNVMLTIDKQVLESAREAIKPLGGSLSAVVENMLKNMVAMMNITDPKRQNQIKKNFDKEVDRIQKATEDLKKLTK